MLYSRSKTVPLDHPSYQIQTLELETIDRASFTTVHVVTQGQDNLYKDMGGKWSDL